jgi:hypothetical protein
VECIQSAKLKLKFEWEASQPRSARQLEWRNASTKVNTALFHLRQWNQLSHDTWIDPMHSNRELNSIKQLHEDIKLNLSIQQSSMTVLFPCLTSLKRPAHVSQRGSFHINCAKQYSYSSCLFLVIIALKHTNSSHLCHLADLAQSLERAQAKSEALASAAYPHESSDRSVGAFLLHAQIGQSVLAWNEC